MSTHRDRGEAVFLYGVRRRPDDQFGARCLPSIIACGGPGARVLTTERSEHGAAIQDLAAQAVETGGFEGLVLLDPDIVLEDTAFAGELRRALAGDDGPAMVCLADAYPSLDDAFAVLTEDVVRALATADVNLGHDGHIARLRRWVEEQGRAVAYAELPIAHHQSPVSTIDRLSQILAASKQSAWVERIGMAVRETQPDTSPAEVDRALAAYESNEPAPAPDPADALPGNDPDAGPSTGTRPRLGTSGFRQPERPDLLCHIPSTARRVLVVGLTPTPCADVIRRATGAHVTTLRCPGATPAYGEEPTPDPIPLTEGTPYDVVVLIEALAQVRDPGALLRDVGAVLDPGGTVIAALPNAKHWTHVLPLLLNDELRWGTEQLLGTAAPVRLFTLVEATSMFDTAGLTDVVFCNGTRFPADDPKELDTLLRLQEDAGVSTEDARILMTCFEYVYVARRASAS